MYRYKLNLSENYASIRDIPPNIQLMCRYKLHLSEEADASISNATMPLV